MPACISSLVFGINANAFPRVIDAVNKITSPRMVTVIAKKLLKPIFQYDTNKIAEIIVPVNGYKLRS